MTSEQFEHFYENLTKDEKDIFRGSVKKECQLTKMQWHYKLKGITKITVLEAPIILKIMKSIKN